jgi:cytochrome c553
MPEGWGNKDGTYPQVAGQHASVIIKQLADIRARNRDTPTMLPFAMLAHLQLQQIADVAEYLSRLPMTPDNGVGPGADLAHGETLYQANCADCHGERGEGDAQKQMPRIQGQHYLYLVRQFEWIRDGKRRNGDEEMIQQIQNFSDRDISAIMDYTSRLRPPRRDQAAMNWRNPDFPQFSR